MVKKVLLICFYIILSGIIKGQDFKDVYFYVRDNENKPVENCLILNLNTKEYNFTDQYGFATIKANLNDSIRVSHISYKPYLVIIKEDNIININLSKITFNIGGIKIVANRSLVNEGDITKTTITSDELEHFQASNLGDIIGLIPGLNYTSNPSMNRTSQLAIRGEFDKINSLSAFGTKVIIDGIAESNNSNMQYEALTGTKFGTGNLLGGIDLRTIPADLIKTVEIIRGVPSVIQNDLLTGVIKVETRDDDLPFRIKLKNNPDLNEATFYGSKKIFNTLITFQSNIARSERDRRIEGDEFTRFTGQIIASNKFKNFEYFKTKISYQFLDDTEEPKGDFLKTKNYNRGYYIGFSNRAKYKINLFSSLNYQVGLKVKKKNTFRSKLIQTGGVILETGDTISTYIGELYNKGLELSFNSKINFNKKISGKLLSHSLTMGFDLSFDGNYGKGIQVDPVFNYYGYNSSRRSYSFKNLPLLSNSGLYVEDFIRGKIGINFSLRFGIRMNSFSYLSDRNIFNVFSNKTKLVWNPRINFTLYPTNTFSLRASAGSSSKIPPLYMLRPASEYFHWRDPVEERNLVFKINKQNFGLKPVKQNYYELSFDKSFSNKVGVALSLYYNYRYDIPEQNEFPLIIQKNNKVYYLGTYNKYLNSGKYYSSGAEISIKSIVFEDLNLSFDYNLTYNRYRNGGNKLNYIRYPEIEKGQLPNYHFSNGVLDTLIGGYYQTPKYKREELLNTLKVSYKNEKLGLWITFYINHFIFGKSKYFNLYQYNKSKLTDEEIIYYDFNTSWKKEPQKFLLNINISKSIGEKGELSFYVNNVLDEKGIWRREISPGIYAETVRNPELFYGLEYSYVF